MEGEANCKSLSGYPVRSQFSGTDDLFTEEYGMERRGADEAKVPSSVVGELKIEE